MKKHFAVPFAATLFLFLALNSAFPLVAEGRYAKRVTTMSKVMRLNDTTLRVEVPRGFRAGSIDKRKQVEFQYWTLDDENFIQIAVWDLEPGMTPAKALKSMAAIGTSKFGKDFKGGPDESAIINGSDWAGFHFEGTRLGRKIKSKGFSFFGVHKNRIIQVNASAVRPGVLASLEGTLKSLKVI